MCHRLNIYLFCILYCADQLDTKMDFEMLYRVRGNLVAITMIRFGVTAHKHSNKTHEQ